MPDDQFLLAFEKITTAFIEQLNEEFKRRLEKQKAGWPVHEIYQEYLQALAVAAIGTSSSVVSAVEGVFTNERMAD